MTSTANISTHRGQCHCGAVHFEIGSDVDSATAHFAFAAAPLYTEYRQKSFGSLPEKMLFPVMDPGSFLTTIFVKPVASSASVE